MLKGCPVKLCTVCRCQIDVARMEAAEQAGPSLQITSSGIFELLGLTTQ